MIDLNKITTDRRKFLKLSIIGILSFVYSSNLSIQSSNENIIHLEEEEIKFINAYNNKRLYSLKNNIEEVIKDDLSKNRTVFLERNLYTYAEIYLLSN